MVIIHLRIHHKLEDDSDLKNKIVNLVFPNLRLLVLGKHKNFLQASVNGVKASANQPQMNLGHFLLMPCQTTNRKILL